MKKLVRYMLLCVLLVSCRQPHQEKAAPRHRGVYHWKTVYNPSQWERDWMSMHHVDRLYVKLFEVDAGDKHGYPEWCMVPVATTRFEQPLPDSIEVVPVVYITVDAIRALQSETDDGQENLFGVARYAELLVSRVFDMMDEHGVVPVREVQVDCDWTQSTRQLFFAFAEQLRRKAGHRNVMLRGTVRLHQVGDKEIPFDRKLLMCYNTGRLQDVGTRNSILDYDDVAPYLKGFDSADFVDGHRCLYDYDVAWPAYGWGVAFDNGKSFRGITSPRAGKGVRVEWGEVEQVLRVRKRLPDMDASSSVIYHLDSTNLSHYSYEEIEAIFGSGN